MCCRKDYRLSIYFLSECTQLRFVQLFNKALLLLLLLLLTTFLFYYLICFNFFEVTDIRFYLFTS